ncbi:MAG: acylphosphatase [Thermoplasmatales archaeon]|nr:acylphosphatase [Thermoplasmatales archaeon]
MIRATITITGDVQEAGYRAIVRDTARKLGLVGFAENMPDGTVNVICEGEKKEIETLVGSIKIKTETINVEKIDVRFEDATGEFKDNGFVVKVGDLGDELFQGYATSLKYFKIGWGKQDETIAAIKGLDKKQDKTIEVIGTRFDTMDSKYGDISETMKEMKNLFEKLVDHIIKKEK